MRSLKWLVMLSLLMVTTLGGYHYERAFATVAAGNQLTLQIGSNEMDMNGVKVLSAQPVTVKNGVSFIPLKSVADQYKYKVGYDVKTKEAIITSSIHEFRFKAGRPTVTKDGTAVSTPLAPFALNGSFMVPIRTWANLSESKLTLSGKTILLSWGIQLTAAFEVQPSEIYAGQTTVEYIDRRSETDPPFIAEQWEGKMDVFPTEGTYTITRQVQDSSGLWSAPYSVTIEVLPPNQPPVADFTTDKDTYRIGEKITYTDLSSDDENAIVKNTWTGKEDVFFEPGLKTIQLDIEDRQGLKASVVKTITVSDEVLYTKNEYDLLFTEVNKKFTLSGSSVLSYPTINYSIQSDTAQMVRSNSPETLVEEGIAYEDQLTGPVRFMFHHLNNIGYPVKLYLLVTNNNVTPVNVNTSTSGIGGPDVYIENTGKLSTARYLQSFANNSSPVTTTIRPQETAILFQDLSKVPIKPQQTLSAYVDLYSDQELTYKVVVVASDKDPIAELPNLSVMERYDKHVRGTFNNANRTIEINDSIGSTPARIILGDGTVDSFLTGYDATSGKNELNLGNFGVIYHMKLNHVAPNTLIALNARGGQYAGAFLVNGELVYVTKDSILKNNTEAAVLYRTGETEESIDLFFTIASGGNLPLSMLLLPLPAKKN